MDFDYNKLRIFIALVNHGSATRAAKSLFRTQSAVSQAVTILEKQLGIKLIKWEGKKLRLTREGQLIYEASQKKLDDIDDLLLDITTNDKVSGCIEIGLLRDHSTNLQLKLPHIISTFRKKHPLVTFKIHYGTSPQIENNLIDQKLDIGFLINFQQRHLFHTFSVIKAEHIVVASSDYLNKTKRLKSIYDVVNADLIDIDSTFTCLTPWVKWHDPSAIYLLDQKKPIVSVPDLISIRELVLDGLGIAVVPRYLIEKELKSKKLVQLFPKLKTINAGVDCAIVRGKRERFCEKLFLQELEKVLKK